MEVLKPHLDNLASFAQPYLAQASQVALTYQRRYEIKDNFVVFLQLNIVLFVFCWFVAKLRDLELEKVFTFANLKTKVFRLALKCIPKVRRMLDENVAKIGPAIKESFPDECRSKLVKIPKKPLESIDIGSNSEKESLKGYLSGSRYPSKTHSDFVASLSARFLYANPLHIELHPCVRQMELEVIRMCAKMMNFTENGEAIGVLLSGGTQSILMAILSAREYGREKGITAPNLVLCQTAHVAAIKACMYFEIEPRFVKYDSNYEMSVKDMKAKMDSNTIMVYTSYPNYPYGTVDPIATIAAYCSRKDIPVHVDMCLGGFLVPFLTKPNGDPMFPIPKGVTSISMDPHKYGLSGKGASILLYATAALRSYQFFTISSWPGGLYATVGIQGSRSGVAIASAWISMNKMGVKGFKESAIKVQQAVTKLADTLPELGFKVFGKPQICTIGFVHKTIPINMIQNFMKQKKWGLSVMQKPLSLHFSFTPLNSTKVDQLVKDLKQCVSTLKDSAIDKKQSSEVELYGACAQIPDDGTKQYLLNSILDAYLEI